MADITGSFTAEAANYQFESAYKDKVLVLEPVSDGTADAAAHKIYNIPAGYAVISGSVVVTAAILSEGDATIAFGLGDGTKSSSLSGTLTKDGLAIDFVANLFHNDFEDTAGTYGYAIATDDQMYLTMTVGTAALTAGRMVVTLHLQKVDEVGVSG